MQSNGCKEILITCDNYRFSIARGQKIPIFSAAGLPHNDVSEIHVCFPSKVRCHRKKNN